MDSPSDILRALSGLGFTEKEIAERLRARGVQVTQPTINRIKTGAIRRPSFEIGSALVRLRDELRTKAA